MGVSCSIRTRWSPWQVAVLWWCVQALVLSPPCYIVIVDVAMGPYFTRLVSAPQTCVIRLPLRPCGLSISTVSVDDPRLLLTPVVPCRLSRQPARIKSLQFLVAQCPRPCLSECGPVGRARGQCIGLRLRMVRVTAL